MNKQTLISHIKGLTNKQFLSYDDMTVNQADYAIIMQSFGISWDMVNKNYDTMATLEIVKSDNELIQEYNHLVEMLKLATNKNLQSNAKEYKLMLKGFIEGVCFFNKSLGYKFYNSISQ